jgi:hypothetical protein
MPEYRAYTVDGEDRITAVELVACADDTRALEYAATLSREAAASIEIWQRMRLVGCVRASSPPVKRARSRRIVLSSSSYARISWVWMMAESAFNALAEPRRWMKKGPLR